MSLFMPCEPNLLNEASNENIELNTTPRSTADRHNSVNGDDEQKCLLYSRLVETREKNKNITTIMNDDQSEKERNVSLILYIKTNLAEVTRPYVKCFKEYPGWSPTVNISWFIAKAYLANLYYTTQRDASLTIQTCDDIIDVSRQSLKNQWFAERTFPVVLSTQWTSIYDKEIQEVLGFYSLCSYVFDKCSSRSVYLGVCPVQFVLYLKLRTELAHGFRGQIITKYADECNQHMKICRCNDKVKMIGSLILQKAYSICSKS